MDKEKEYEAVCAFGSRTDTQDATGEVLETGTNYPTLEIVQEKAQALTGEIRQRPSMYSAIKVGGKPLYARARQGESIEVPERTVTVYSIDVTGEEPDHGVRMKVRCGKGTYIRTLCDDLGRLCGCPAHMRSLLRTQSGVFTLETALSLDEARELAAEGRLAERMLPPDAGIRHLRRVDLPARYAKPVAAGAKIPAEGIAEDVPETENLRAYLEGEFWGIMRRDADLLVWKALIAPERACALVVSG